VDYHSEELFEGMFSRAVESTTFWSRAGLWILWRFGPGLGQGIYDILVPGLGLAQGTYPILVPGLGQAIYDILISGLGQEMYYILVLGLGQGVY